MNIIHVGFCVVIVVLLILNFVPLPTTFQFGLIFLDTILVAFLSIYLIFEGDGTE